MTHITTCSRCGTCYEESSEEAANEPARLCIDCYRVQRHHEAVRHAIHGAHTMDDEIKAAIDQLNGSGRGQRALAALGAFICDHWIGLDDTNQGAVADLLDCATTHPGSVRDALADADATP